MRRPIPDAIWDILNRRHDDVVNVLVERATNEPDFEDAERDAVSIIREIEAVGGSKDATRRARREDLTRRASGVDRSLAVAAMRGHQARAMPDVIAFRRDVLHGEVVLIRDVPAWVEKQARAEPYPPVQRQEAVTNAAVLPAAVGLGRTGARRDRDAGAVEEHRRHARRPLRLV
ncbi:hypothetical protein CMK11_01385 [Candidatus Poribacteria bacterium]|jgi:hypothetical protein|nr:hypothetical protein [Candidatus Poribacteria bacterium]